MSDPNEKELLDKAVAEVENKLEESVKKYEAQVQDAGKAANEVRDEVKALSEQYKEAIENSDALKARVQEVEQKVADGYKGGQKEREKTWGEELTTSEAFDSFRAGNSGKARLNVQNNTIIGEEGSPQEPADTLVPADRLPGIVPGAFRMLNVLDFVPMGTTNSNAIEYTRELSWTNDAAETAEGGSKPESDLTFELVNEPVRTIAHWIKVSKQVLDDAPALQSYVDRRLRHGVRKRLQEQVLKGNGTSPNIEGLSSTNKSTAFSPTTGDNQFDTLNRAKYAVIASDYSPDFIILNPADWGSMERLKVGSSDDRYLVASANAAVSYLNNGLTPMVWGMPVVVSNDVASGKFYLGSSAAMQLFMRQGAVVEMYEQDDTNVQKNLITVRAELRAALAGFRPAAIQYGDLTV